MKATVLTLVVLMSLVSMNVCAKISNESILRRSLSKEYVINHDEVTTASQTKIVYTENAEGNRTAKIVYHLEEATGNWIVSSRTTYKYNENNELAYILNAYWNKAQAEWTNIQVQKVL